MPACGATYQHTSRARAIGVPTARPSRSAFTLGLHSRAVPGLHALDRGGLRPRVQRAWGAPQLLPSGFKLLKPRRETSSMNCSFSHVREVVKFGLHVTSDGLLTDFWLARGANLNTHPEGGEPHTVLRFFVSKPLSQNRPSIESQCPKTTNTLKGVCANRARHTDTTT